MMSTSTQASTISNRKPLSATLCAFACAVALSLGSTTVAAASFDFITLNFTGGLSESQKSVFTQAELWWEGIISGYQPVVKTVSGVTIDASASQIDGVGLILGSAGPYQTANPAPNGGYVLPTRGEVTFDSADIGTLETNSTLFDVITHEIAHVLGFGTLWTHNGLYVTGSGKYTGASGLAAYQTEFDLAATFVPVELDGGDGTANGHWNEGGELQYELMTGWYNEPAFLSNTTRQSFVDLGYTVNPVPLPGAVWLFLSGLIALGFTRRRRA
ncbi:MAG: hypothetical protein ABW166_18820 [Sedimenticola sp.]